MNSNKLVSSILKKGMFPTVLFLLFIKISSGKSDFTSIRIIIIIFYLIYMIIYFKKNKKILKELKEKE